MCLFDAIRRYADRKNITGSQVQKRNTYDRQHMKKQTRVLKTQGHIPQVSQTAIYTE